MYKTYWNVIQDNVKNIDNIKNNNFKDAINELKDNLCSLVKYKYIDGCDSVYNNKTIGRNADLFIGLYNKGNNNIKITINMQGAKYDTIIKPGEFSYALENKYILPLINLNHINIYINTDTDETEELYIIYGYLRSEDRVKLVTSTLLLKFESNILICRGDVTRINKNDLVEYITKYPDNNHTYIYIPDMNTLK